GALWKVLDFLNLIIVVVAGDCGIDEIWQGQDFQQNQTIGIQTAGGNDVPREWRITIEWIVDGDDLSVGTVALREVALTFECGRHVVLGEVSRYAALQHLQVIEAEEFRMVLVPLFGNVDRTSEREALRVIAIFGTRYAIPVIEEIVGIEILVPHEPVCSAMILAAAGFAHYLDDGAAVAGILGLIRVQNHLDLADGVHR